jgi:hypothetical protein
MNKVSAPYKAATTIIVSTSVLGRRDKIVN